MDKIQIERKWIEKMKPINLLIFVNDFQSAYESLSQLFQESCNFEVGVRWIELSLKVGTNGEVLEILKKLKRKKSWKDRGELVLLTAYIHLREHMSRQFISQIEKWTHPEEDSLSWEQFPTIDLASQKDVFFDEEISDSPSSSSDSCDLLYQENLNHESLYDLDRYLKLYPNCYAGWYVQGFFSEQISLDDHSKTCWLKAYDLNPESLCTLSILCDLQSQNKLEHPIDFCAIYQKIDPSLVHGHLETHLSLFQYFRNHGDPKKALGAVKTYLDWAEQQNSNSKIAASILLKLAELELKQNVVKSKASPAKIESEIMKMIQQQARFSSSARYWEIYRLFKYFSLPNINENWLNLGLWNEHLTWADHWKIIQLIFKEPFWQHPDTQDNLIKFLYEHLSQKESRRCLICLLLHRSKLLENRRTWIMEAKSALKSWQKDKTPIEPHIIKHLKLLVHACPIDIESLFLIACLLLIDNQVEESLKVLTQIGNIALEFRSPDTLEGVLWVLCLIEKYDQIGYFINEYQTLYGHKNHHTHFLHIHKIASKEELSLNNPQELDLFWSEEFLLWHLYVRGEAKLDNPDSNDRDFPKKALTALEQGLLIQGLKFAILGFFENPNTSKSHGTLMNILFYFPKDQVFRLLMSYKQNRGLPSFEQIAFWLTEWHFHHLEWKEALSWLHILTAKPLVKESWFQSKIEELQFLIPWFSHQDPQYSADYMVEEIYSVSMTTRTLLFIAYQKAKHGKTIESQKVLHRLAHHPLDVMSYYFAIKTFRILNQPNLYEEFWEKHPIRNIDVFHSPLDRKLIQELKKEEGDMIQQTDD